MNSQCLTIKDYKLFKLLGKGSFGEVYLSVKENSPKLLATKRIDLHSPKIKKMLIYIDYEISIMKELSNPPHPNIICLYDLFRSQNHYYVVMEYCNGGSLLDCLKKFGKPFPVIVIQYLMRQIIEGLKYIHSKSIIHRDIKLDNILVNFNNKDDLLKCNLLASEVKIIDFGLAKKIGPDGADTFIGTPFNMAPTILGGFNEEKGEIGEVKKYNQKADIWSLGTICYQMLTGNTLFQVNNIKDLVKKAKSGKYSIPTNLELSNEIVFFLNCMLQQEEKLRWSANRLATHPFLTKDVSQFTKLNLDKMNDQIEGNELKMNAKTNSILKVVNNNDSYIPYIQYMNEPIKDSGEIDYNISNNKNINKIPIKPTFQRNNSPLQVSKNIQSRNAGIVKPSNAQTFNFPSKIEAFVNEGVPYSNNEIGELERLEKLLIYEDQKEKMKQFQNQNKVKMSNNRFNLPKNGYMKYILGLQDEYNEAKNYFRENNLPNLEQDALNKYMQIENTKNLLESGQSINNLIMPINPEYIYGYSSNERNKRFNEVLNYFKKYKLKIETEIKNYEKFILNEDTKQKLNESQIKLQKLNFIIKEIEKKYSNIWVPAPEYTQQNKQIQVEKISYVNCPFSMKIQVKKINLENEQINIIIYFKINKSRDLVKEIKLTGEHTFEEWIWTLNSKEWGNIDINDDNYIFSIFLNEDIINKKEFDKNNKYNISKIIKGQTFSFNVNIPKLNNKYSAINVSIIPIFPKAEKFVVLENIKIINIQKLFPAFEGKSPDTNKIPIL